MTPRYLVNVCGRLESYTLIPLVSEMTELILLLLFFKSGQSPIRQYFVKQNEIIKFHFGVPTNY